MEGKEEEVLLGLVRVLFLAGVLRLRFAARSKLMTRDLHVPTQCNQLINQLHRS
jgi:hypothetical protein